MQQWGLMKYNLNLIYWIFLSVCTYHPHYRKKNCFHQQAHVQFTQGTDSYVTLGLSGLSWRTEIISESALRTLIWKHLKWFIKSENFTRALRLHKTHKIWFHTLFCAHVVWEILLNSLTSYITLSWCSSFKKITLLLSNIKHNHGRNSGDFAQFILFPATIFLRSSKIQQKTCRYTCLK